jgi:hypothetical protein
MRIIAVAGGSLKTVQDQRQVQSDGSNNEDNGPQKNGQPLAAEVRTANLIQRQRASRRNEGGVCGTEAAKYEQI